MSVVSEPAVASLMQDDFPLSVDHIRRRMTDNYADVEVVTLIEQGDARTSYGEVAGRVDRLAHALRELGVRPGDRVGTLAWNSWRHLELYFAVPCSGAVLHTLNLRLSDEQLAYVVRHAEDTVVFVDDSCVEQLARIADQLPSVRHFVVMGDGDASALPGCVRYEDLLAAAPATPFAFPATDERAAAALCYTSGTTGHPKGVRYSHRSITLHALGTLAADSVGLSSADRVLAVVPMFHVNAWGLPFAAPLTGATLVLPSRHVRPDRLAGIIAQEQCSTMNAVPTVFADLLRWADAHGADLRSLEKGICGGAAMPESLAAALQERHGVRLIQAWGMTETSPLCTIARPAPGADADVARSQRLSQGRLLPLVEARIVKEDGTVAARDGATPGELQVRGPWVARAYVEGGEDAFEDGWLRTGDIGTLDRSGYLRLSDRAKDVIKSGGEWISSVELENALVAHAAVAEAAVVAMPDERWSERPLACVVLADGAVPDVQALRAHLAASFERWMLPDAFAFLPELPKTSTGKLDKKLLRHRRQAGELELVRSSEPAPATSATDGSRP